MVNPLEEWIIQKTSGVPIKGYQLEKIQWTVRYAKENSPFYKEHLKDIDPNEIKSFRDVEKVPFTTFEDIVKHGDQMLCVPASQIERIVTLATSGTTGEPKRIYFTKEDQELTIDFFHHGMQCLVGKEDRVMILLPCSTPGCVGDLLARGLDRLGCEAHPYGLPDEYDKVWQYILAHKITSIVGNPIQVGEIAEAAQNKGQKLALKSVLLSTEYVPKEVVAKLESLWGAKVYEHYGMTEMGLGGGVHCSERNGYHLREADLYFEVISREGAVLADGKWGEVVFTTLTRKGMPLIRYKTGDVARFKDEVCACSKTLRLMDKVKGRIDEQTYIKAWRA